MPKDPLRKRSPEGIDWSTAQEPATASGVSVIVRGSLAAAASTPPKRNKHLHVPMVRSLLLWVIAVVGAVLLLGVKGGVMVVVVFAIFILILWLGVRQQRSTSRGLYTESTSDWMSRRAFYEGPFDGTGLRDASSFEKQHSTYNNPPGVRVVVTSNGLVLGSAGNGGTPLKVPFTELQSVELFPGPRKRMVLVTPARANRLGTVVLTTTEGRVARFSGIPPEGLEEALERKGASINQPS